MASAGVALIIFSHYENTSLSFFGMFMGLLALGIGAIGYQVGENLVQLESNWSLPKEERKLLRRMPRDRQRAYIAAEDDATRESIIKAELERERKYEEEFGWPKKERKASDESLQPKK